MKNDEIIPVKVLGNDSQKLVVFDDFICEKNQKPLVDYFVAGRNKNCSVIYLSQSFCGTPRTIRLNCTHYCIFNLNNDRERDMITKELRVPKEAYDKATREPYSFLYVDKPKKTTKKKFYGKV